MKIKLLDKVLENLVLDINKEYNVIETETIRDDVYYTVVNENGKKVGIHELLVEQIAE